MVDKATTRLMIDLLNRQGSQQRNTPDVATQLQSRPSLPLPPVNINPQAAQILSAVIGSGKTTSRPVPGGTLIGKGNPAGSPMMASRADMIAERDTKKQEEEWPTPPPGSPYTQEQWSRLSPYERRLVVDQVAAAVQGTPPATTPPATTPEYATNNNLRGRGGIQGDPLTRQYAATGEAAPPPANVQRSTFGGQPMMPNATLLSGPQQPGTQSYATDQISQIDAYLAAKNYAYPPPGAEIDQADWEGYDTDDREAIAIGMKQQYESMPAPVAEGLEAAQIQSGMDPNQGSMTGGEILSKPFGWIGAAAKNIVNAPSVAVPYGSSGQRSSSEPNVTRVGNVVDEAVEQVNRPIEWRRQNEADIMYYMATHNGEMPDGWEGALYGGIQSAVSALPDPGGDVEQPTLEDVKRQMSSGQGVLSDTPNTNTLVGPMWLSDNEWAQPVVARIYEDAEATRKAAIAAARATGDEAQVAAAEAMPGGSEAVHEWFAGNQSSLAKVTESLALDPLNLVFVTGIAGRGFIKAGEMAYLAEHPYLADVLRTLGVVVKLPDTIMNKAPEKLFEGLGWGAGKSRILAPSDSAIRETASEGVTESRRAVTSAMGDDAETALMAEKARQADEALIAERNAAEKEAIVENKRFDVEQKREVNRLEQEGIRQNADEVRAIREEGIRRQEAAKINNDIRRARAELMNKERTRIASTTDPNRRMKIRSDIANKLRDLEPQWRTSVENYEQKYGTSFDRYVDDATFPKGTEVVADDVMEQTALREAEATTRQAKPFSAPTEQVIRESQDVIDAANAERLIGETPADRLRTVDNPVDNVAPVVDNAVPTPSVRDDIPDFVRRMGANQTPEEMAEFYDEVAPIIQRQFESDDALRQRDIDTGGKWDSDERIINETLMEAQVSKAFEDKFGVPSLHMKSNDIPIGKAGGYKGPPGTTRGQIQRAVFGTEQESIQAFENLARQAGGNNTAVSRRLDDLIEARRTYAGSVPADLQERMSSAIGTPTPRASTGPDPWDTPTASATDNVDDLKRIAIDGDPAESTAARFRLRNDPDLKGSFNLDTLKKDRRAAVRKRLGDDVVDAIEDDFKLGRNHKAKNQWYVGDRPETKAQQAATERAFGISESVGEKTSRNPSVLRIVSDPKSDAAVMAESTKAGLQRAVDAIPDRWARPTADLVAESVPTIKTENLQYAERLQARFRSGKLTQTQIDGLTKRTKINIGTKEKPVEVETSFWERFNETVDNLQSKRDPIDFTNATTLGEIEAANKRFLDEWAFDQDAALKQTGMEFNDAFADPSLKGGRNVARMADRALKSTMGIARQNAMYNPITGPGAALQDFLGNMRMSILGGEGGAGRQVIQIAKQLSAAGADPETWMDIPDLKWMRDMGIPMPADVFKTMGREQIERTDDLWTTRLGNFLHIPNQLNALHLISSETMKKLRQFQDSAWRISTYANYIKNNLGSERVKLLRAIEKKTGTREGMWREVKELGPYMSVDDIAQVARKYGVDESVQRTWAKQLNDLSRAANKKQNQLFFTYKKTRADELLGRGFMFHYWMTRNSILYMKLMMQHPQLIRLEHELWGWTEENKSKIPQPEWMHGWVGWAIGNGHAVYTDPTAVLSGLTVISQIGESGFNRSKLDALFNETGLFLNPIFRAAFSVFGKMSPGDPMMITGLRRMLVAVANEVRNSDYGKEKGWDGFQQDWYNDALNWIVETANDKVKGIPGAQEIDLTDSVDQQANKAQKVLMDNMMDQFGDNPDDWTDEEYQAYVAARDAIYSGAENEDAEAAIDESIRMDTIERLGNVASPTSVIVRDQGTVENDSNLSDAYSAIREGTRPTEDQQGVLDLNELKNIAPGNPTDLTLGYQKYQAEEKPIGTAGWNQIVYDYMDIPDDYEATIGGKKYYGSDIKAMTDDERKDLANQWVAQQDIQIDRDATDGGIAGAVTPMSNMADYTADRKEIRGENANLDDFLSYRSWMYDFETEPGGIRRIRDEVERAKPNSKFTEMLNRRRETLMAKGLEGEELETELDDWMTTEEAYAAMMGWGWKRGDDAGESAFDVEAYPWREKPESSGTSGTSSSSSQEKPKTAKLGKTISDAAYDVRGKGYDISSFVKGWV